MKIGSVLNPTQTNKPSEITLSKLKSALYYRLHSGLIHLYLHMLIMIYLFFDRYDYKQTKMRFKQIKAQILFDEQKIDIMCCLFG